MNERFPVCQPRHAEFGKRRKPRADDVRGYVWAESAGRWYHSEKADDNWGNGPYPNRASAEQACLMAYERDEWAKRLENTERFLRERLAIAETASKAQLDLQICMDVVCGYRGPRGEHYKVELVSATKVK